MNKYEVIYKELRTDGGEIDGRFKPLMPNAEQYIAAHGRTAFNDYWLQQIAYAEEYGKAIWDGCNSVVLDTESDVQAVVAGLAKRKPYKRSILAYTVYYGEYNDDEGYVDWD